ncbi:MAG: matrixin family metalloprotease [Oscillospiraceae bacterium]|nr:matrixin family metalloprotease [Oscillospiraceae bacterium]
MRSRRKLQRIAIILLSALTLVVVGFVGAGCTTSNDYLLSWHLVDSGKHCDWDANQSKYESYVVSGAKTWNAYKAGVFRPDSISVVQDVRISDVSELGESWLGETSPLGYINLNKALLDEVSSNCKQNTVLHELGHALGLDHNDNASTNIMYSYNTAVTALSSSDKSSYDASYARY